MVTKEIFFLMNYQKEGEILQNNSIQVSFLSKLFEKVQLAHICGISDSQYVTYIKSNHNSPYHAHS